MQSNHPDRRRFFVTMGALAGALACPPAIAQRDYPSRLIKVINPWTPGGPADAVCRPIVHRMAEELKQPVIMENRPGANGTIGTAAAATAPPDGYTLLFAHVGPMSISPNMGKVPYDALSDLIPITQVNSAPLVLLVRNDLPIRSIEELIAHARANPGKLTYGSVGTGSTTHLAGEMLAAMTGARMTHVPYKGAAPALTDLIGGQISFAFVNSAGAAPHIASGRLRGIAVTTLKRSTVFPDLPTVAETLPGFEVNSWYGFMAPAGTPKPIVAQLQDVLVRIVKSPEITAQFKSVGLDVEGTTSEEFAGKIRSDYERWGKLIKQVGVTAE